MLLLHTHTSLEEGSSAGMNWGRRGGEGLRETRDQGEREKNECLCSFAQGFTDSVGMSIRAPQLLDERIWISEQGNDRVSTKTQHAAYLAN